MIPPLMRRSTIILLILFLATAGCTSRKQTFKYQEVMIPVRDGAHLQTVILTPVSQQGPLPILFRRTPYGVPDKAPDEVPPTLQELMNPGAVDVVPRDRPKPAEVCPKHLSGYGDGLRARDSACLLLTETAIACRATGGSVNNRALTKGRSALDAVH